VLVIAHRLGTIRRANRIAVLEDGRITANRFRDEELVDLFTDLSAALSLRFMDVPSDKAQDPPKMT